MNNYPLPNLFIPGVQKAGTSALASLLSQHPDICLVQGKEAHVFDDPEYHLSSDKLNYAREKYASKLKHYNGERYILDATPVTIVHPLFVKEVTANCPSSKYIVTLRDPVERALSHYAMTKQRGRESRSPLIAFMLEKWRMKNFYDALPTSPFESAYRDQSYLIRSNYQHQLNHLYSNVAKDNVLVTYQEDLLSQHHHVLSEIFSFLEIPFVPLEQKLVFQSEQKVKLSPIKKAIIRLMI